MTAILFVLAASASASGESHWFDAPLIFAGSDGLQSFDEPTIYFLDIEDLDRPGLGYSHADHLALGGLNGDPEWEEITITRELDSFPIADAAEWSHENTTFCRDGQYDLAPPLVVSLAGLDPRRLPDLDRSPSESVLIGLLLERGGLRGEPLVGIDLGDIRLKDLDGTWTGAPLVQIGYNADAIDLRAPVVAISGAGGVTALSVDDLLELDLAIVEVVSSR